MKKILTFFLFAVLLVSLTACGPGTNLDDPPNSQIRFTTPGPNPEQGTAGPKGGVAGLGTGLWHGFIAIGTLIMSFVNPEIEMYEVHNNGPLYNLGFLLGAVLLFALLGFSGGRRR